MSKNKKEATETQETTEVNFETVEEITEEVEVEMIEKDKYIRLYSEFENFKRRTQKEKDDYFKSASQKVLLDIIPTLDNFERAGVNNGEFDKGVVLIYEGLKKTLEKHGVKEVEAKGLDFNSDIMEALTQISAGDEMKGKVVDVVEKGYELNGKVIRFAKVVVGA